jgi:hypothetical protein
MGRKTFLASKLAYEPFLVRSKVVPVGFQAQSGQFLFRLTRIHPVTEPELALYPDPVEFT